jgi:prepilin-type N-terminal cleavage/methylation domain-containing protein
MKKSFTLIELIFVLVIIGLLASFAVPKFMQTRVSASATSAASVVSSVRTAIEAKHGEWIINDDLDTTDGYTPQGYPQKLDDAKLNSANEDLFNGTSKLKLLKKGIKSCLKNDCWYKKSEDNDKNLSDYIYKFNDKDYVQLEYNGSNGMFECVDSNSKTKEECESFIK